MGAFNAEQEVANSKRKNVLKDVDADLRDQIPSKLAEKCDELGIGNKVVELWTIGNANRTMWLERQQLYLRDWDEHLVATAQGGAFSGTSNLHIPLPLIICKTAHARFMQALFGIDPPFLIKGRTEGQIERADDITGLMRYVFQDHCNEFDGIEPEVDKWIWDWITAGSGIMKGRWDCQYERFVDVEDFLKEGPPQYSSDPRTGKQVMHRTKVKSQREVTKTIKKFEGLYFETRQMEDILLIGGAGDPQKADSVIDRYFLTASDIWTLVDRKLFREEEARDVIKGGWDHTMGALAGSIKLQRANDAGKSVIRSSAELDRFEILEAYMKYDIDGSGINSEIVAWVHYRSKKLLRANYLRRMIKSGERPFFKIDYHKRPEAEYGVGLVEMMHPLTVEYDAIRNMKLDFGLLSTMPFGFYRATSNVVAETLNIEPGALIPLDNPQTDVYFPNLGNRTVFGYQEEDAIYSMLERLTSMNDMSQGVMTGAQGPTRTATGARALLGEQNTSLDIYLKRLNRGWKKLLQFAFHMLQQRIEPGFMFRVTGEDGSDIWKRLHDRDQLMGDFDFQVVPNSSQSNMQIQQDVANQVMMMTQNPLDIQLGIIGAGQRYEALKNWFKVNQIKEWGKYITKPQGYVYLPTPQEEVNRILRGMDVPVMPNSDHQGFLAYVDLISKDPDLLGQWNPQQTQMVQVQYQKHMQMMKAIAEMQAQQANANQMRMNAQNSMQQTMPGRSPMGIGGPQMPDDGGGGSTQQGGSSQPQMPPQVKVG